MPCNSSTTHRPRSTLHLSLDWCMNLCKRLRQIDKYLSTRLECKSDRHRAFHLRCTLQRLDCTSFLRDTFWPISNFQKHTHKARCRRNSKCCRCKSSTCSIHRIPRRWASLQPPTANIICHVSYHNSSDKKNKWTDSRRLDGHSMPWGIPIHRRCPRRLAPVYAFCLHKLMTS